MAPSLSDRATDVYSKSLIDLSNIAKVLQRTKFLKMGYTSVFFPIARDEVVGHLAGLVVAELLGR